MICFALKCVLDNANELFQNSVHNLKIDFMAKPKLKILERSIKSWTSWMGKRERKKFFWKKKKLEKSFCGLSPFASFAIQFSP